MDCCARCTHSNDTIEFGDYFRCDHDDEIHWKEDVCDRFEQRAFILEDFEDEGQVGL